MRRWTLPCAAAGAMCLALTLASCASAATAPAARQPTVSPTSTATPSPTQVSPRPSPVVGLLGPAPTDCAAVAPPRSYTATDFGGGFSSPITFQGDTPTWELGLGSGTLHLNANGGATPYPATKVMWVVGPNYAQPVALAGHDVRTGAPLWFQVYPSNSVPTDNPDALTVYTTHATLDQGSPNRGSTNNSSGHWDIWGIGVVVLTAGCYELDVASAEGGWRTVFAAGR